MSTDKTTNRGEIAHFHAHLDECKRCREQPFNLCPIGLRRLKATSQGYRAGFGRATPERKAVYKGGSNAPTD
jgi:hypothetical protein